ncbi:MAG: hypothetical protein HEQ34_13440, partial [Sphingorhabdus sp.]|uniref:hypothetical protein n=1 Tax=Sphingorhabdus sp. TaxID=1902408 RepID=UPI0025F8C6CC
MSNFSLEQALQQLRSMSNPTLDQLRLLVAQTRVTQSNPANPALDNTTPVRAAILYSGDISPNFNGSRLSTNALVIAMAKADPSLAIVDNTHVGRLLSDPLFQSNFDRALAAAGPNIDPRIITSPTGGFWSNASERFTLANANSNILAFAPKPASLAPGTTIDKGTFSQVELRALLEGTGSGKINGIELSALRDRYNALKSADPVNALKDATEIVSVKSLADMWTNVEVGQATGNEITVRVKPELFSNNGLPEIGEVRSGSFVAADAQTANRLFASSGPSAFDGADMARLLSKSNFIKTLSGAGKIAGPVGDLIEIAALTGAVIGQLRAGDREGAARTAANGLASISGGALAAGVAATYAAPLLASGPVGWFVYTIVVVGSGIVGSEVGQAVIDKAYTAFTKTLPDAYRAGDPLVWIGDAAGVLNTFITTTLPNGLEYAARITRELINGELDIVKLFTGDSPTPQEAEIIVTANRRTGQTTVSNLPSALQDPALARDMGQALLDFARSGETLNGGSASGNAGASAPSTLASARTQSAMPGQGAPATPVYRRNSDGTITVGSFKVTPQGTDEQGGFRIRDEYTGSLIDLWVDPVTGVTNLLFTRDFSGKLEVTTEYEADGKTVKNTALRFGKNPDMVQFSDAAGILGDNLGYRLANGNKLTGPVYSATLKTLGQNFGEALDAIAFGSPSSVGKNIEAAFSDIGNEFLTNLKSAAIGALSSFVVGELVNAIGVDGVAGEWLQTSYGAYLTEIIANLPAIIEGTKSVGQVLGNVNIGNIAGSFVGAKLAALVWTPETIGGQIGAAVGAALAPVAVNALLAASSLVLTPIGVAVVAFIGFLVGGLIGSLFGGTPRSGADSQWDSEQQKFVVTNVWSRKGGPKDAAKSLASAVSESFNTVLSAVGGTLLNPTAVQSGSYGIVKKEFVYRPHGGGTDQGQITQRFSGQKAAEKLIGYGVYKGLTDPDFQIAGGNVYVKRALYSTFAISGNDQSNFDTRALLGNLASGQQYASYIANAVVINSLVAAEPESLFAAETLFVLARASDLGLTKRAASDWYGGFSFFVDDKNTSVAQVQFGFDYDFQSRQISRQIGVGDYIIGDTIDIAGQTTIEAGATADIIDLRSGKLANQIGYTVNGTLNNDIAVSGADFTALSSS